MYVKRCMSLLTLFFFMVFSVSCYSTRVIDRVEVLNSTPPPTRIIAVCDVSGKWVECARGYYARITAGGIEVPVLKTSDSETSKDIETITVPLDQIRWIEFKSRPRARLLGVVGILMGAAVLYGYLNGRSSSE